jgi:hypothetical protein
VLPIGVVFAFIGRRLRVAAMRVLAGQRNGH